MTIKKKYSFSNDRQLWRLLISATDKLIIEERDINKKQVFFNCLDIVSGNIFFRDYQLEEKYWAGIEEVSNDIIYFHKYAKPDMPGHKGIIAFDVNTRQIIWQSDDYVFLFLYGGRIYCFRQKFEEREFFTVDALTGELLEELGNDAAGVNTVRMGIDESEKYASYTYPEVYTGQENDVELKAVIDKFIGGSEIKGDIEHIVYGGLVLFNFYEKTQNAGLVNRFVAADMESKKKLVNETINSNANAFVPDSFFMKDNLLLLLKEKKELIVYIIS